MSRSEAVIDAVEEPRKRGRPAGSKNKPIASETQVEAVKCAACESTERGKYYRTTEDAYIGDRVDVTHVVRRWCQCSNCGQHRIERTLENRRRDSATQPPADD